jgi:hypothetical protein
MSNARLRLAFARKKTSETMFPLQARFADKALRAFPTPLHAHGPEAGP